MKDLLGLGAFLPLHDNLISLFPTQEINVHASN